MDFDFTDVPIFLCEKTKQNKNYTSDMFTHTFSAFSDVHSVLLLKCYVVLMGTQMEKIDV